MRLRTLLDLLIDYGAIALVAAVAAVLLLGPFVTPRPSDVSPGLSGIGTVIGALLALLAVKLWRDVRANRDAER